MADILGAQPVYDVSSMGRASGTDGFLGGGNGFMWIILILLLIGGNGNGLFGGGGIAANGATNLINNDFLYSQQKVDALGQSILNQTTAINQSLCNGFNNVTNSITQQGFNTQMGFANMASAQAECCCAINRNIDSVRFENAQNTCTITNAINASTQTIVDKITQNEIQNLRDQLLSAKSDLNNTNQTVYLINQLRPAPVPAYSSYPIGAVAPFQPFGNACCS